MRKIKISHFLQIQMTSEQFSKKLHFLIFEWFCVSTRMLQWYRGFDWGVLRTSSCARSVGAPTSKIGVNGSRKWRFLKICEFVWLRSNFPTSIRSRPIQECRSHVRLCVSEKSVLENRSGHDAENDRNFRKSSVSDEQIEFWRPCRGLSPGKGFAPNKAIHYMTRRAFLALRVIQRQGKSSFNMLVKNWCKWFTKMKISQNLWIRFTPDQFFRMH